MNTIELDELLSGTVGTMGTAVPPAPPATSPVPSGPQARRSNYSHKGMVDLIVANPGISQNEIAAKLGYSASWVSQIISSDAFQVMLADRTKEIVDPAIRATVEEQFKGLIFRSLEVLREKMSLPSGVIPDNLALRTAELSSRALGYGVKQPDPQKPAVEMHVHLEQLGENLTRLLQRKKLEVLDTTFNEIAPEEDQSVNAKKV